MKSRFSVIRRSLNEIVLGKENKVELCLCCMLAKGHLLIEDLPGMGKTLLAHSLAKVMGLDFSRIQFTSDMLPADITGVSVFEASNNCFRFHPGPVFSSVVLADEINRASPKAQSALLEAMEERQVSVDGTTHTLPAPFFVIATQNPLDHSGTFSLPESQLDRFFMRISLGYPSRDSERVLLEQEDRREMLASLEAVIGKAELLSWQKEVKTVKTSPALIDYVQDLVEHSRNPVNFISGISPRAAMNLVTGAQAWAMLSSRDYVIPEDVQDVLPAIIGHRLKPVLSQEAHIDIDLNPVEKLMDITPV